MDGMSQLLSRNDDHSVPISAQVNRKHILITGGAGFVGSNLVHHFAELGQRVLILDNLSRPGVLQNTEWLCREYPDLVDVEVGDVRDARAVQKAVHNARTVYHLAAQVVESNSLADPRVDFHVNALGTLNVLEAVRSISPAPPIVFTSTHEVYGALDDIELVARASRYVPRVARIARNGIAEDRELNLDSPYGCSKGCADRYVLNYARSFGLAAAVFRMCCVYGPHQWGDENHGCVAHFLRQTLARRPVMIYGDGRQVRDLLYVEDLVQALDLCASHMSQCAGRAFNIGGGPQNALSLLELLDLIGHAFGVQPRVRHTDWRAGDQRFYVSDTTRFSTITGWQPRVKVGSGIRKLHEWIRSAWREESDASAAAAG
jgi:CDP-paratose 2-epimerase